MKTLLAAIAALALIVSLASCSATQPATPPQAVERVPAASASVPTTAPAPDAKDPAGPSAPEPATTLVISDVLPMAWTGTLDPPNYTDIFELRDETHNYLADTAAGPRFLLTHAMSLGNPPAPGNLWQELAVGDRIDALGSNWRIVERVEAPKSWPTDNPALMDRTVGAGPGTLVLITCVPRFEGAASHNLILTATKEAS